MIKERLAKLIDVKSIITILLTVAFVALTISGNMTTEFMTIYTVVIGFYFGTQQNKPIDPISDDFEVTPRAMLQHDGLDIDGNFNPRG